MIDIVYNKSIKLFEEMDEIATAQNIPEDALSTFKHLFMDAVADITIHFMLVVNPNAEGFELWKRTMGLQEYCKGAIVELENGESWDVNWFKNEFGIDLTGVYKYIYNYFMNNDKARD